MSMCSCAICGDIYDTDDQMEVDEIGNCICDICAEDNASQCDCCAEEKVCRTVFSESVGDTTVCHECSNKS